MTPVARFVSRILPRVPQAPVLGLIYALMLAAVVMVSRSEFTPIIYVDVRAP